ncbi:LysR family transcriptional regulator [Sphingomonas changnyeongensis]|uniref:LysR family transcriptional regulator n=1 Tax=Sphingomonas changnyeongensis TaxID=2698679 RepID=A0A7Z2NV66_9SPHN|nr:LysR substrate-binding domain-containing protein [Sphingomonas changnyeongensis]QHL90137.1 LysR family transcriptional regulator [Sphingomonas changnyeongensis]
MSIRNLDLDLLRTFVTIADTGGFTRAGDQLGRTQSAISLQVKRLEEMLGRAVLERSSRTLRMTVDGEKLLSHARQLLRLNDEALADLLEPDVAGLVRLGVPEDFATVHLPVVLAAFTEAHPLVELEVTCDLTLNLLERFRSGDFDLVLVKREPATPLRGVRVWREPLVWVGRERTTLTDEQAVPLIVSPQPCVYRKRAIEALEEAGRRWRIAYTSTSLTGAQAAVKAGLGVTVLPREMVPTPLHALGRDSGLPPLDETEIALIEAAVPSPTARLFAEHVIHALERQSGEG